MSTAEEKADVQVTHPGHIFPFGPGGASPIPLVTQWCRFTVPERLPLRPFRQDRLVRLPLPPSVMATSSKSVMLTGAGVALSSAPRESSFGGVDPFQKIQQLEKNIAFIQETHAFMLQSLHEEVSDLKQKNRELQFQLVTGLPALPEVPPASTNKDIPPDVKDKIEKLEKEIRKLRSALKDALKTNSSLTNQLQMIKRHRYTSSSSASNSGKHPSDSAVDSGRRTRSPEGPSPEVEEYSDTLRQIQRATGHRSGKNSDSRHGDWGKGGSGYLENRRGYHHHHHHHNNSQQMQSMHHHQQQPRLPRLPLRNHHQNYLQHQYETQYRQRSSNVLPVLKQPHANIADHRVDKQRKSRLLQGAKVADRVSDL